MATGKKILVTGGAGFIGFHTVQRLAPANELIVLDNLSRRGAEANLATLRERCDLDFVRMDITEPGFPETLRDAVGEVDAIIHLAAQVAVTLSEQDPRHDFKTNALGTFNVLEYARLHRRRPMVLYSSTNKVYGDLEWLNPEERATRWVLPGRERGMDEATPLDFHSPYGCSKGCADQYVRDYWRIYGVPTVCFRQSCIYGDQQFGVEDQGWIAWFLIAMNTGRPITIYGDGKQVRDVLHVADLTRAYELAIDKGPAVAGEIFNIGGGPENALSLKEFFAFAAKRLGLETPLGSAAVRSGDQRVFIADNAKVGRVLGWRPETAAPDGIEALDAWIKDNLPIIRAALGEG